MQERCWEGVKQGRHIYGEHARHTANLTFAQQGSLQQQHQEAPVHLMVRWCTPVTSGVTHWPAVHTCCLCGHTCRYMAPEVFRHEQYTNKVDVYRQALGGFDEYRPGCDA